MSDDELATLAKVMAAHVRDCVAEGFKVPPELAEQIASAVRLLHESPAVEPKAAELLQATPRLTRIKRDADGNFIPVYEVTP